MRALRLTSRKKTLIMEHMSCSLHSDLSPASELRASIAPNRNDFFLHHVRRNGGTAKWILQSAFVIFL